MRRTLVQLDEDTYRRLRHLAFRQERSISAVVRDMIARGLAADWRPARRTTLDQMKSVRAGRSKQGRLAPVSERHDEALATAFQR
jgi:predicted transcriptional regulator